MNKKILLITILILFFSKPVYTKFVEINMCLDVGICAEGIETKIDGNLVKINEENCKKLGRIWIDEIGVCDIKKF